MKAVGATSRFIVRNHLCLVAVLGLLGTLLGLAAGVLAQPILPWLFAGLLSRSVVVQNAWRAVLEGLLLGSLVVGLFAFLPLYRLRDLKPNVIFQKEDMLALSPQHSPKRPCRGLPWQEALQHLTAIDRSLLPALPKMAWALWQDEQHRAVKMHVAFEVLRQVPVRVSVPSTRPDAYNAGCSEAKPRSCWRNVSSELGHTSRRISGACSQT